MDLMSTVDIILMASDRRLTQIIFPTKVWALRGASNLVPPLGEWFQRKYGKL